LFLLEIIRRSIAAGLSSFFLIKKKQKIKSVEKASLPHEGFALQIRQNRGCNLLPCWRALVAQCFCKSCYALPPYLATIVLPDFTEAGSTDAFGK
jgi:hypothetical protein